MVDVTHMSEVGDVSSQHSFVTRYFSGDLYTSVIAGRGYATGVSD